MKSYTQRRDMAARLPDDLLHMICGALSEQRDFNSLFQCACSGKQLAVPALASIYRQDRSIRLIIDLFG